MACGAPLGQGGNSGAPEAAIMPTTPPTAQEIHFECHVMPKRSRVRRETLLGMIEEEEIVSEAQPELAKKDEDGRPTKKQKRDHYRQKYFLFCRSRPRAREKSALGVMRGCCQLFTRKRKRIFLHKFYVTARQEVL